MTKIAPAQRRATWGAVTALLLLSVSSPAAAAPVGAGGVGDVAAVMAFEPNVGLADDGVAYLGRAGDATLLLRADGVDRALTSTPATLQPGLRFVGASPGAVLAPGPRQGAAVSYFVGNDPSRWRAGVPLHDGVTYRGLYPGVDLRYDGTTSALNGTFLVRPGADPGAVRWRYTAGTARVDGRGDLRVGLGAGMELVEPRPRAWQTIDGARRDVPAAFALRGDETVGITVGAHDPSQSLVVAPGAAAAQPGSAAEPAASPACPQGGSCTRWATFLGSGVGIGPHRTRVGTDRDGNIYVAGNTACPGCLPTVNAQQSTYDASAPYVMMFVSKFDPTGSRLLYSTYVGGPEGAALRDLAVTDDGTVYLAGDTPSAEYPVTAGAYQTTFGGGGIYGDGVVTSLGPDGQLRYSTYLGGGGEDGLWGIDVAPDGDIVLVGFSTRILPEQLNVTGPFGYPTTAGAHQPVSRSPVLLDYDAVVTVIDAGGSALSWSTGLGGQTVDYAHDVAVDAAGDVHVVGTTMSTDFPTTAGAPQTAHASPDEGADNYVTVFDGSSGALARSTYLGGSGDEAPPGVALDAAGAAYVAGGTTSADFSTTAGAYQTGPGGGRDAFVWKADAAGAVVYATLLGGGGDDAAGAGMVVVDPAGRAYVTGVTQSPGYPTSAGAPQRGYAGGTSDAFVTVVDAAGSGVVSSSFLGGGQPVPDPCACPAGTAEAADQGRALTLASDGDVVVTGTTNAPDFPTTPGTFKPAFTGTSSRWAKDRSEVFVARLRLAD